MSSIIKSNRVQVSASSQAPRRTETGTARSSPASSVRPPHSPATGVVGSTAAPRTCAKTVRLLELAGRVHALELVCSCGEVTVVELDYPDASNAASADVASAYEGAASRAAALSEEAA